VLLDDDPDDPHRGGIPVDSVDDLRALMGQ
jgi:hypothetical protein